MADFRKANDSVLRNVDALPPDLPQALTDVLARPGTYNLFDEAGFGLRVPLGNDTWKGQQARLVAQWGGDGSGNRPVVTARDPIVDVALLSATTIEPWLWVYVVTARPVNQEQVGLRQFATQLELRNAQGGLYATSLPVTVVPELATPNAQLVQGFPDMGANWRDRRITIDAIIDECNRQNVPLNAQIAYILATAQLESNFLPTREVNHMLPRWGEPRVERYRRTDRGINRYYPYYGRGYAQLTWNFHYRRYTDLLGVDLMNDPDLALQPNIARFVIVHGMMNGIFTGARLDRYVNARTTDFVNARRVVNGLDRAQQIAGFANGFLTWLDAGRVGPPP